jgi:TolB-like protein/Flp pilus assembly protein TadD
MTGKFIGELKRRNVPRAALLYVGAVWALAQGIAQLGPELGAPEATTRWFLIAACIGFPIWLVISWRYELTSQGFRLESEVDDDTHDARKVRRRTDLIIIGVLAIAVVLLLTDRVVDRNEAVATRVAAIAADGISIAVLPLVNESGDKDQQYFSDGLSEGFIVALSRIKGVRVIGRNSSFQFRDPDEDGQAIAAKLGVSHLLEGSVRRVGDTVRVSASLIKAVDGSTLWAEKYDRPYKDLFALQDEITGQVANALKAQLQPAPAHSQQGDRPPGGNLDAYNAYMKGIALGGRQTEADTRAAIKQFDTATTLDPAYGLAYSWKARVLIDAVSSGLLSGKDADDAYAQADAAIKLAIQHAPNQAPTHIARGWLLMSRDLDWRGAEAEFKRAVELAPNDGDALNQLGFVRASQGDLAQAVDLTKRALKQDPLNQVWYQALATYLMPLNRLDESGQAIAKAIELHPGAVYNHFLLTINNVLKKGVAQAQAAAEAEPEGGWHDFALALAAQIGPDRKLADAILKECIDKYASDYAFQIAEVYAVRGEPDAMFEWLDKAREARDPGMQTLLYDALLLRYRADPRYAALARQVGLPNPPPAPAPASASAAPAPAAPAAARPPATATP